MAKGHPDFFGQSIFPHLGSPQTSILLALSLGGALTTDIIAAGKGTLTSGRVWWSFDDWDDRGLYRLELLIDGVLYFGFSGHGPSSPEIINNKHTPLIVVNYDNVNHLIILEIAHEINFNQSVVFTLSGAAVATNAGISGEMYFYLVEG